jgi:transcriptional regulator with XRE-family HTH domain
MAIKGMIEKHPLEAYRIERGLSQAAFGALIGASGAAISRYETGARQPRGERLKKLVEITGLPASAILGMTEAA